MLIGKTRVPLRKALFRERAKVFGVVPSLRHLKVRKFRDTELKFDIAPLRYQGCIVYRFGDRGKETSHLFLGLYIEFVSGKTEAGVLVYRMVCSYADQYFLYYRVFLVYVVTVICGDKRYACLPRESDKVRQNSLLIRQVMILDFNEEVALAHYFTVLEGQFLRLFIVSEAEF